MKKIILGTFLIACSVISAFGQCEEEEETKVLLVGDSWAFFMAIDETIDNTLKHWGHSNYTSYTNATLAVNGARTDDFMEDARLLEIKNQLLEKTSIEVVHLSIGGNDFLGDWNLSMTEEETEELGEEVYNNILAIIEFIKGVRPNIHVVWSGYMYANFEEVINELSPAESSHPFYETWENMGFPTFEELNDVLNEFSYQIEELALVDDRLDFVNVPALMQRHFGQEVPLEVDPGGTYPAMTQPLPYGDITYPSPKTAMRDYGFFRDAFHLTPEGYFVMLDYQMKRFYQKFLMDELVLTGDAASENGYVSSEGNIGDRPRLGEDDGELFSTLLSFDTESMPDTIIEHASIFLRRDSISINTPINSTINVKIKNGSFGDSYDIEPTDYLETGDEEAEACVFGMNEADGNWIRIDLPETFFPYINNDNKTQFILSTEDASGEVIYLANAIDLDYAPILNIDFKSDFVSLTKERMEKKLMLFPNPASNSINILIENEVINRVEVLDLKGRVMIDAQNLTSNHLDISSLSKGSYFIKVTTENEVIIEKIVKN